ncbi:hypothetical protein M0804_013801 [Polistes exclamans]|nr:hypothetical protein M0804_013801 [Polistes exclamans]
MKEVKEKLERIPLIQSIKQKLDKIAEEILDHKFTLTAERLQDLHKLLVAQPSEDTKAEDPLSNLQD